MTLTRWELKRRDFLRTLGVGLGMMPLLLETRARAQAAGQATRFIVLVKGDGCRPQDFWPVFPGAAPADHSLATATLPYCTAPLTPFKSKLVFPDGLMLRNWLKTEGNTTGDNGDAHHDWGSLLTGALPSARLVNAGGCRLNETPSGCRMNASSASLDAWVGKQFQKQNPSLPYASLSVGSGTPSPGGNGYDTASWLGVDQPNTAEVDPYRVFNTVFANLPPAPGTTAASLEEARKRNEKIRLLDFVQRDVRRFGSRLGTEDRQLLDGHLDLVATRQKQLEALATPAAGHGRRAQRAVRDHRPCAGSASAGRCLRGPEVRLGGDCAAEVVARRAQVVVFKARPAPRR